MVESQTERTQGKPHLRNPPEPQSMDRLVALTVPGEKGGEKHWSVHEASWQQSISHNPHLSLLGNKPQNKGFRKGRTLEESRDELYVTCATDRAEGNPF